MTDRYNDNAPPLVRIPCPVCGSTNGKGVYHKEQYAGNILGRYDVRLEMCDTCTFIFQNPRPTRELFGRYYAEDVNASGKVFAGKERGTFEGDLNYDRSDFVLSKNFPSGTSFIDLGCGTGWFLKLLKEHGKNYRLTGLEPSVSACEMNSGYGYPVVNARLEDAYTELGTFDVVTNFSVLEHVYHPTEFLTQAISLVRDGGYLFVNVPDTNRPFMTLAEFYIYEHVSHFTYATLEHLLARLGMEIVDRYEPAFAKGEMLVMAVKKEHPQCKTGLAEAKAEALATFDRYREEKERMETTVREKLLEASREWRGGGKKVALYGAGVHTLFLLGLVDIAPAVTCILDSDPAKWGSDYQRWTVRSPGEIERMGIEVIVISSRDYEREIYSAIKHHEERGVQIIRFYNN